MKKEAKKEFINLLDKHINLLYFSRKANLEFSKFLPLKIYKALELT